MRLRRWLPPRLFDKFVVAAFIDDKACTKEYNRMDFTFFGHATFLMTLGGKKVVVDPFFTSNPLTEAAPSSIDCDYMLITHAHFDHIEDAVVIAKNTGCKVITNYEIAGWLRTQGVENVQDLNHGGTIKTSFGKVKYVNAVHSSVLPDGSNGGNAGGFVLFSEGKEVYHAGDTALHMDMKLLGDYNNIDLALLPIGDTYTMGVDDAVIASDFVKCDRVIGMHYNTFPVLAIDSAEAVEKFKKAGKELILMEVGSTLELATAASVGH